MTLEEAIQRMIVCATAERCAREEACFTVVMEMKRRMEVEALQESLRKAAQNASVDEDDNVMSYVPERTPLPHWESGRVMDWSAA